MSHVITFYTEDQNDLVVKMINLGFAPLMCERRDAYYFSQFKGTYKLWSFEKMDWTDDLNNVDLSIAAPDNFDTDWLGVVHWLRGIYNLLPLIKPVLLKSDSIEDDCDMNIPKGYDQSMLNQSYQYNEKIIDKIFFAEIIKPENGQKSVPPYCIVIEDWDPDKMVYMFSSICYVPSFGKIYPADRNFIKSLWEFKKMKGSFNLQQIADQHVQAVKEGNMHEPVVYRKSMGEVIDMFNEKNTTTGSKRKLEICPCK